MTAATVFVVGEPAPQGSKRHVGNGRMIESSRKVGPWREAVVSTIAAQRLAPIDGPVRVDMSFTFRMPKSRTAAVRRSGLGWKATRPDLDKLVRSTLDGLVTSGLISDDSLVVSLTADKWEIAADKVTAFGALITVTPDPTHPTLDRLRGEL